MRCAALITAGRVRRALASIPMARAVRADRPRRCRDRVATQSSDERTIPHRTTRPGPDGPVSTWSCPRSNRHEVPPMSPAGAVCDERALPGSTAAPLRPGGAGGQVRATEVDRRAARRAWWRERDRARRGSRAPTPGVGTAEWQARGVRRGGSSAVRRWTSPSIRPVAGSKAIASPERSTATTIVRWS